MLPPKRAQQVVLSTLLCASSLTACGGGDNGQTEVIQTAEASVAVGKTQAQEAPTIITSTVALPTPGWSKTRGLPVLPTPTQNNNWYISQNARNSAPNGSVLLDFTGSAGLVVPYDFGCGTSVITVKTGDCRDVVAGAVKLSPAVTMQQAGLLQMRVRSTDATGRYALRLKDESGQTLQYALRINSIEQSGTDWADTQVSLASPSMYWSGANNGVITGKVTEISLIASPRNSNSTTEGLHYPAGKIELADLEYLPPQPNRYVFAPNIAMSKESFLPTTTGRMAVSNSNFDRVLLQQAKDAGFGIVRRDLFWEYFEKNGAWTYAPYEKDISNLGALGMQVLWILDYGHPDHGGAVPASDANKAAFQTYVKEAVKFSNGKNAYGYEVWNEPDTEGAWPSPNPAAYSELLKNSVTSIRSIAPNARILSGGVGIDDLSYLFKVAETGALGGVNHIAIHPYRKDTITKVINGSVRRHEDNPETYAADRKLIQRILASKGIRTETANTEWGYSTVDFLDANVYGGPTDPRALNRHAILTLRMVLTQLALNEPLITVYRLIDKSEDHTDKEMNFGLIDADGVPKPAYQALKKLHEATAGLTFKGYATDTPPGMHVLRWASASTTVHYLWNENPNQHAEITFNVAPKRITTWDGKTVSHDSNQGRLVVRESLGPIVVHY